jgi:hypothetical protein
MLLVSQQVELFDARFLPPHVGGVIVSLNFLSSMVVSGIAPVLAPPLHGFAGRAGVLASEDRGRPSALARTVLSPRGRFPHHMLFVLGQVVGDCEPWRFGADENVLARADGRVVDEGSHGDVDEGAVEDDRIE